MSVSTISPAVDNKTSRRLLGIIEEFRKLNPNIQAGQMVVFLNIMAKPGITMKELERATGLSATAVSRNVMALSEFSKADTPGYDLVESYDDIHDRRNKRVRPKASGVRVYNSLIDQLGS